MSEPSRHKSHPKKHHYVPQSYLERFGRDRQIGVFDKTRRKAYRSSIRDAAAERHYYTIPKLDELTGKPESLEAFCGLWESAAGPLLAKLANAELVQGREIIDRSERLDLCLFLAVQIARSPEFRETIYQDRAFRMKKEFLSYCARCVPWFAIHHDWFDIVADERHKADLHAVAILDEELRVRMASALNNKYWVVLRNVTGRPFYTSDNIVAMHSQTGGIGYMPSELLNLGCEVSVPVSGDTLVLMLDKAAFPQAQFLDNSIQPLSCLKKLEYHNSLQVLRSSRFVFSAEDDFALAESMLVETPELGNAAAKRFLLF